MQNMTETIRAAISKDKRSLYRLAKDCELPYATIHRFATRERTAINLVTAERMCEALGLELRPVRRKGV